MSAVQQALDFPDLVIPDVPHAATLEERFAAFDAANPQVAVELRKLALDMVQHGARRVGIALCFEVLRWSAMQTRGDDAWKLNNSYRALYARKLMGENAELAGVFETRRRRAE